MRRSEKEITDRSEIDAVIRRSKVCRLGLSDHGQPYVVPLCFGYDGHVLYLHCAGEGRKLDILRQNANVCVEFDVFEGVIEASKACQWGMRYQSVMGFGIARFIEDREEKRKALSLLMAQYTQDGFAVSIPEDAVTRTVIIRIDIRELTGKQSARFS